MASEDPPDQVQTQAEEGILAIWRQVGISEGTWRIPCQVHGHVGLSPTHDGGLDHTQMGKLRLGSTDLPRSWSAWVSGRGGSQVGTRPAPWLTSVCLCLRPRPLWAPRPWPTHDGRSSISTASPSGHPSPASGHRRNGLFVLPAPCRSLGRGREEMTIFCLGGQMDRRGVQGTKGRARLGCDRTPAGPGPSEMPEALPCSVPPSPLWHQCESHWHFPTAAVSSQVTHLCPCHGVGWAQVSAATRWEVPLSEI